MSALANPTVTVPSSPATQNGPISQSSSASSPSRQQAPLSDEEKQQFPALIEKVFAEAREQRCWWAPSGAAGAPLASPRPTSGATERLRLRRFGEGNLRSDRELFLQVMNVGFATVITADLRPFMSEQRLHLMNDFNRIYRAAHATVAVWDEMKRCYALRSHLHRRRTESGAAAAGEAERLMEEHIRAAQDDEAKLKQQVTADKQAIVDQQQHVDTLGVAMAAMKAAIEAGSASQVADSGVHAVSEAPTTAALRSVVDRCDTWLHALEQQLAAPLPGVNRDRATKLLNDLKAEATAVRCRLLAWEDSGVLIAIVGGENEGKSTFANSLTGMALLLATNGRCSMVLTYLHFNVHSPRARKAGQKPAFEILLTYHSKEDAQAELLTWRTTQLSQLTTSSTEKERKKVSEQCDEFGKKIAGFPLPDKLETCESGETLEAIANVLDGTGGVGKEHMMFLLESVHIWVNVAKSPFGGLPPLCVVDCPGYNSAMTLHAKLTEAAVAASDVNFYILSVAVSQVLSDPARLSLRRLIHAADCALGEHLAVPERKEEDPADDPALAKADLPVRELENLFVIGTYVQENVITHRHQALREELRDLGVQRNGVFFADARLPAKLHYAAMKEVQLFRAERGADEAEVDGKMRSFDDCTNEWLLMYSQFRAFAYSRLPSLLQRRLQQLLVNVSGLLRQVKDARWDCVQRAQSAALMAEQALSQATAEVVRLQQRQAAVLSGATAALVWPTFEEQVDRELRYALEESSADERARLQTDGPVMVQYLGGLLSKLRQQWRELHDVECGDQDSCIDGTNLVLQAGDPYKQQVLASYHLLAELLQRAELERQYARLCDALLQRLAEDVEMFLTHHFTLLTKTPFRGSSIVRQHLEVALQPTKDRLIASITSGLRGVAVFFSQVRTALLLYPLDDHYGERRLAVHELTALLQSRLSSANGDLAKSVNRAANGLARAKVAELRPAIDTHQILERLTVLAEKEPRHLPLPGEVKEKEQKADAGSTRPDAAERQAITERLAAFTARSSQDGLKEQLRTLCPRFQLVIQDGFRELGRVGVAQHFGGLLSEAGAEDPQRLSAMLRDLLLTLAQGTR